MLITGAASGIGAAIARRLASEGGRVALVDRDPVVPEYAASLDGVGYVVDVAARGAAETAVAQILSDLGGLDGLVNCAAIQRNGSALDVDDAAWEEVLAINLSAPLAWIRAALPPLLDSGAAAIVNLTSVAARHALPNNVSYVATKHGLLGVTRSVAVDFGRRGVRCNAISPGSINTPMFAEYVRRNPEKASGLMDQNFAGRFGEADEVAALCAYLLSDEAGFTNGAEFLIDGGRTAAT
ncbi:SDR family NAD(P)-dependent oxidoreductase [Conexibacter sp. DBS9H8]|uniref:SDR family NAD(P)-dependent oxidoreductase n=1 Tax=Conexibacter sp. DBS9H8 TaxID=2937801 RepID=UPI00200CA94A|nr:SDR family oxidoreductase [Conexibacter sp. DBS9H8]